MSSRRATLPGRISATEEAEVNKLQEQLRQIREERDQLQKDAEIAQESYIRRQAQFEREIDSLKTKVHELEGKKTAPPALIQLRNLHHQVQESLAVSDGAAAATAQRSSAVAVAFRAQLQDIEDQLEVVQRRVGRLDVDAQLALWAQRSQSQQMLCTWLEQECGRLHAAADSSLSRASVAEVTAEQAQHDLHATIELLVKTRWELSSTEALLANLKAQLERSENERHRTEAALAVAADEIRLLRNGQNDFSALRAQVKSLRIQLATATAAASTANTRAEASSRERDTYRAACRHLGDGLATALATAREEVHRYLDLENDFSTTSSSPFGLAEMSRADRARLLSVLRLDDKSLKFLLQPEQLQLPSIMAAKYPGCSAREILEREIDLAARTIRESATCSGRDTNLNL